MTKRFHLKKPAFKAHYTITSQDDSDPKNPASYHVAIRKAFATDTPSLTLTDGSEDGPGANVLAASWKPALSENMKVAIGDPADEKNVQWEELHKAKISRFEYNWLTNDGQKLTWKRTSSEGVDGATPSKWSPRNWKLVDDETQDVLAVFTADKGLTMAGTLEIRDDKDGSEEWEIRVIMTLSCMFHRTTQGG